MGEHGPAGIIKPKHSKPLYRSAYDAMGSILLKNSSCGESEPLIQCFCNHAERD